VPTLDGDGALGRTASSSLLSRVASSSSAYDPQVRLGRIVTSAKLVPAALANLI
jgi:hypothetical protein